jgi:hypothetical protein
MHTSARQSLVVTSLAALTLAVGGCAERTALVAEREALLAELEARTQVMNAPGADEQRTLKSTLDEAVSAAREAVPPFEWPRLAQGLASFSATGRYEEPKDDDGKGEATLTLSGPGDARYAAQALSFTARLAPGLVLDELSLTPETWSVTGHLIRPPASEYVAPAVVEVPVVVASWPWNTSLASHNAELRARILAADQTIGASPVAMEQKKFALARFVDKYESPGRMPFVSTWIEKLVPHMKRVKLVFAGRGATLETEPIDAKMTMEAVASTLDVGLVTTSLSIDEGRVKGEFMREEQE